MSYWTYADRFGILIDNEKVLTEKKLGVAPGNTFYFSMTQKIYENFTITEEGITGDRVSKGQSVVNPMYENIMNQENVYTYPFPSDMSLPDGIDEYRAAAYVVPETGRGAPYIQLLFKAYPDGSGYSTSVPVYKNGNRVEFLGQQMPEAIITTNNLADGSAPSTSLATPISAMQGIGNNYWSRLDNANYFQVLEISTNIPIFDTQDHCKAYLDDESGETDEGIVNPISPDYEEEYLLDQKFYFIHNSFTHYYHGTTTKYWRNYRFKPGYDSKIRLYRDKPNSSRYYTMVLIVPGGMTRFVAPEGDYNESSFEIDEDSLQTHYCEYSFQISRVAPRDEVVVTSPLKTNIPIFGSREDATKYANDELSIEDALNYSDILAFENELPQPDFGEEDAETETGINGQTYMAGSTVYVLTRPEMIQFFTEIFKIQDPSFINAFKDGNLLFGDNQANAIIGCMYFPFDAADVCSLESGSGSIWVGGWQSQNATGRKVNMNDKVLTVGEFFLTDMYQDVRDYEPYTQLFVQLPYCGTYQLSIQKYINKTVKINYAVDIFTGACTALIYANNILLDSMDGMIGSQRPVTGRTAANMLQAITRGSASVAAGAAGGIKMGGIAASIGGELSGAYLPAFGASVGGGAMFSSAHAVAAGTALAAGGAGVLAGGAAVAGAVAGVDMMYKAKNAYADPPMSTRGQYSGNLGMFSNQKVHFIVAMRHNHRPENELDVYGYPSGRGGLIGSFSGFLKSSCVQLADGFVGSVQERNEILQMIAKGIYI